MYAKVMAHFLSFLFVGVYFAGAQETPPENLLTEAMKAQVRERAKTEAMEREFKRSQERQASFRRENERHAAEVRRQTERIRNEQQRLSSKQQAINQEINTLQRRGVELSKALADIEERGRTQEIEALKATTELETLRNQLLQTNEATQKRREMILTKIKENYASTGQLKNELTQLQDALGKAEFNRFGYDKMLAQTDVDAVVIEKQLEQVRTELAAHQSPALPTAVTAEPPTSAQPPRSVARYLSSEGRAFKLHKLCNIYERPNPNSTKLIKFRGGVILKAEPSGTPGFFKAIGPDGTSGFVREICGDFE